MGRRTKAQVINISKLTDGNIRNERRAGSITGNFKSFVMSKPYWKQRQEMKLKGPKPASAKRTDDLKKGKFFADALKSAPSKCMECGDSLRGTMAINPAAIVAHILAKSKTNGVPSMAIHPLNKVYLCGDCHTNMDNQGCSFIRKMKIYELMKGRVATMWPEIPKNEERKVPECLRPHSD
jgi:hypothetical protein